MSIESEVFLKFTPDIEKLIQYGFNNNKSKYIFNKTFLNNTFKAIIAIDSLGNVSGKVIDNESNEEYLPIKVEHQVGGFVGEVREEYIGLLTDIRDNCFKENYFISEQGNRITDLIYKKYGDKPAFLWEDLPTCGVFKNPSNNKWYGIIMYIERTKLNEPSKEKVEVMNIKLDKDKIPILIKQDGFYPAYHMNKKYWITITLDGTIKDELIFDLINESHRYTEKKLKKST